MTGNIDWGSLSSALCLGGGTTSEIVGTAATRGALERILGTDALRASVDDYVAARPGSELARSVLRLLHPPSAMERCHEIYLTATDVEDRRCAVELLRVVADDRVLAWAPIYLADPDPLVQVWAIGIVEQLRYARLADDEACASVVAIGEAHPNESVRESAQAMRQEADLLASGTAEDREPRLLSALAHMCEQYLGDANSNALDHQSMSAGEGAVRMLIEYGLVRPGGRGGEWTKAGRELLDSS